MGGIGNDYTCQTVGGIGNDCTCQTMGGIGNDCTCQTMGGIGDVNSSIDKWNLVLVNIFINVKYDKFVMC